LNSFGDIRKINRVRVSMGTSVGHQQRLAGQKQR